MPSGQGGAEAEIETFSWENEGTVGAIRLQELLDTWWGELQGTVVQSGRSIEMRAAFLA